MQIPDLTKLNEYNANFLQKYFGCVRVCFYILLDLTSTMTEFPFGYPNVATKKTTITMRSDEIINNLI